MLIELDKFNIIKLNTETIYCVGDLHGNFDSINNLIKSYELKDCCIIFCGDIGFGFNKMDYYYQTLTKLNKLCKANNVHLIFIRGNHDDPSYFNCKTIIESHIVAVSDYTVIQNYPIEDIAFNTTPYNTILCIGGATSIDRVNRNQEMELNAYKYQRYHNCSFEEALTKVPKYYWEGEQPIYNSNIISSFKEYNINIETICAHTCPSFCEPLTKNGISFWMEYDEKLGEDIDIERKTIDDIYNHLKEDGHVLSHYIYGHYHYHHTDYINGTSFILLDMERYGKFDTFKLSDKFTKTIITNNLN